MSILDEGGNLIYSQRSVTMRGNRINLLLNTFYRPRRNVYLLGASSQEADVISVDRAHSPGAEGFVSS